MKSKIQSAETDNQNRRIGDLRLFQLGMLSASIGIALWPNVAVASSANYQKVEEVVVTARRKEENIQDVPIAISIYSQEQLDQANIVSGADLALYNPSLAANNRFGSDQASFAIRGFTQELRTTSSVGVYFAEVVAPRGSGLVTGGDGAGPGYFFDLQNVQVLKGPQGTLFGRNTTGGAVVLTPQKPTDAMEGYLEVGAGNYGMERVQGALNIPMGERVRGRIGFDSLERDGYLNNKSGIGPSALADTDYTAARVSLVIDVTDNIENYSIINYLHSENNGVVSQAFACNPGGAGASANASIFGYYCYEQLEAQGDDFYSVMSVNPDPKSEIENIQFINTTTWDVSDNLTVKNILSYAEVEQNLDSSVFGTAWLIQGYRVPFVGSHPLPGIPSDSETSLVEELQFQGLAFGGDLTWQAGLYFENNKPDGASGTASPFFAYCDPPPDSLDPNDYLCFDSARFALHEDNLRAGVLDQDVRKIGFVQVSLAEVEYTSKAIYSEATYTFSDSFNMTAGLRYTEDETESESRQYVYYDVPPLGSILTATPEFGAPTAYKCTLSNEEPDENDCLDELGNESDAVTGQISFNYYPIQEVMTYAKYSKGYRQASVNVLGPLGLRPYEEEEVDAYELGVKASFEGYVSGSLNISAFFNDLTNQQLQATVISNTLSAVSTTSIVNVGRSEIAGLEMDATLQFPWLMTVNLAYTYLDTEVKEYGGDDLTLPANSSFDDIDHGVLEGGDLTFSPKHSLTAIVNQMLPVPVEWGDMSVSATYVYTDEQLSTINSPYGVMPSYELWNFNYNWRQIFGSSFDAALFVTNAFDEEVTNYVNGLYDSIGSEYRIVGEPKMYGAKIRYTFD